MSEATIQPEPIPSNADYYREVGYYQETYSPTKPGELPQGARSMYLETVESENGKVVNRRLVFDPERWRGLPIKIGTAGNNSNGGESANLSESIQMVSDMLRAGRCMVFSVNDPTRLFALAPKPQGQTSPKQTRTSG